MLGHGTAAEADGSGAKDAAGDASCARTLPAAARASRLPKASAMILGRFIGPPRLLETHGVPPQEGTLAVRADTAMREPPTPSARASTKNPASVVTPGYAAGRARCRLL